MSFYSLSLLTRRSILQLTSNVFTRAAEKKPAGGGKKKPVASKKKRFDRGPEPLALEKMCPELMAVELPGDKDEDYPAWLFEIDEQLPRNKPIAILKPTSGIRYFKQKNRLSIKTHNNLMAMTKGRGI